MLVLKCPERATFVLEYDRGTETAETLLSKLEAYEDGLSGFVFRAVILVAESAARLGVLRRQLSDRPLRLQVLSALLADIRSAGMYADSFRDARSPNQEPRSLCGTGEAKGEVEG